MNNRKHSEDVEADWSKWQRPKQGQIYMHYKGGKYEIVATGLIEHSLEACVVYRSIENGLVWVRTAVDFFASVECDSRTVPRFKALD